MVNPIDDGGVSISFLRDGSNDESSRVVLSVEVQQLSPVLLTVSDEAQKACQRKQRDNSRPPRGTNLC